MSLIMPSNCIKPLSENLYLILKRSDEISVWWNVSHVFVNCNLPKSDMNEFEYDNEKRLIKNQETKLMSFALFYCDIEMKITL